MRVILKGTLPGSHEIFKNVPVSENLLHPGKIETVISVQQEKFFTQHYKLFQHHPFIRHIWDALREGFASQVKYHKFNAKLVQNLNYICLSDWISHQKQDIASGVDGAKEHLTAAEKFKKKLEMILQGDSSHNIFLCWKLLENQSIGWEPDLNDGIHLKIRPFFTVPKICEKALASYVTNQKSIGKRAVVKTWILRLGTTCSTAIALTITT